MRVLGINGIRCNDNPVLPRVCAKLSTMVELSDIEITQERNMAFYEIRRMRAYRDSVAKAFDDGTPTLIVGHSVGGVIACGVAKRFEHSLVMGIITINAPHEYLGYGRMLDGGKPVPAKIVTFGSSRDRVVLWGTAHAESMSHTVLEADHYRDIGASDALAATICRKSVSVLFPERSRFR